MPSPVTKKELQDTIDDVAEQIEDLLDPALTREVIVQKLQDLDGMLNGPDEVEDAEDESDEDESESDVDDAA